MMGRPIILAGAELTARASGALWWADERLLCVADLHLGKAERLARNGGALLPPYETRATLARVAAEVEKLNPATVICLGDSFDDMQGAFGLADGDRATLDSLMKGRHWTWIAGNHDPRHLPLDGCHATEIRRAPLTFRHEARPEAEQGEVSGHYHPKLRIRVKHIVLSRPCFLLDATRIVLPAFGTYTGGLLSHSPALRAIMRPPLRAVLTGEPCLMVPLADNGSARLV